MFGSRCSRWVTVAVLMTALAGVGCTEVEDESRRSESATSSVAGEVCLVGQPSEEGVECQAFRTEGGDLYTLLGDLATSSDPASCHVPKAAFPLRRRPPELRRVACPA